MRPLLTAAWVLWGVACARSPEPRLYTLVAQRGNVTYQTSATIEVRRPTMAGYLDRRDIVRAVLAEKLELAGDAHWAEPLDEMFGRVLAGDLALRLPESRVFTDANTLGAVPDTRIDLELQRFERGAEGLVLRALVAVRRGDAAAPVTIEAIELKDTAARQDTDSTVSAMNALLGDLADRIARLLAADVPSARPVAR